jgi:cobalt-zinc-cadmium efflux system protein
MSKHDHHHHHHAHLPSNDAMNKAFAWSVILNLLFTITEIIYALIANSMSLLADAGHNFSDVLGLLFAWGASWLLTKPAGRRFSYGYKKSTILAALANGLLLILATGMIAYESILRLMHPSQINEKIVIVVALIGILVNGGTALLFRRGSENDLNIKAAFLHLAYDALIAIGVVIAGIMIYFVHWLWLDPVVSLIIVLAILWGTWGVLRDSINLILDAVPIGLDHFGVQEYLMSLRGVTAVHDLHIWGLSTREVALTAHLVMPDDILSDEDYVTISRELKMRFKINHVTLQVEKGSLEHTCEQIETC